MIFQKNGICSIKINDFDFFFNRRKKKGVAKSVYLLIRTPPFLQMKCVMPAGAGCGAQAGEGKMEFAHALHMLHTWCLVHLCLLLRLQWTHCTSYWTFTLD